LDSVQQKDQNNITCCPHFDLLGFHYLQAQHQQNQDLLASIQGLDTRKQALFGKNPGLIKISTQNVLSLCSLPNNLSRADAQSSGHQDSLGKAVQKNRTENMEKECVAGQIILSFCHADQISVPQFLLIRPI
jgi:hypothetical protein